MSQDQLRYDGRVAVVTGAGGGLGRAYALLLGSRGAKIVVNDLGGSPDGQGASKRAADVVVDEIKAAGGDAVADYNSVVDGAKVIETAVKNFGRVDILINNAGILRDRSITKTTDPDWDLVNDVHLKGSFRTTQAALPYMEQQCYGRIIMTSSNSAMYGNFGQANYSAAKMGLIGLANTVAIEGRKYNIHCNVIIPTAASRLTQGVVPDMYLNEVNPNYIAPVVAYLVHESCKDNGSYIESGAGWAAKIEYHRGTGEVLRSSIEQQVIAPEYVKSNWKKVTDMSKAEWAGPLNRSRSSLIKVVEDLSNGNFREEIGTYKFDAKDLILYAMGIGASLKNDGDSKYLYENHPNFTAFPTFFILPPNKDVIENKTVFRAFDFKIHFTDILAGEHYFEVMNELPITGILKSKTKVLDTISKGSGALCVINSETCDDNGRPLAFLQSVIFTLNAGKLARTKSRTDGIVPTIPVPNRTPDSTVLYQTKIDQMALYRLSGDTNPHNIDPKYAAMSGFEAPAMQGLCTLGFSIRAVLAQYANNDPVLFKALKIRYTAPVYPGQTLKVEMWKEGMRVHFRVLVDTGKVVIDRAYVDLKETNTKL